MQTVRKAHSLANESRGGWTLVAFVGDYSSMYRNSGLARIRHALANAEGPTEEHSFASEDTPKPETRVIKLCGHYGYEAVLVRNDHPYLKEHGEDAEPGYIAPVDSSILEVVERELRLNFLEEWDPFRYMGYQSISEKWGDLPSSIKDEMITHAMDSTNPPSGDRDDTYWVYESAEAAIIGEDNHRFLGELARIMRDRRQESAGLTHERFVESLIKDDHGQYQPQIFAELVQKGSFNGTWHHITNEDLKDLVDGPDSPYYWDAWDMVSQNARFFHERGQEFRIHHEEDVFVVDCHATESDLKPFYG